jgi:diadenosine tetraphosphate (Ap4A) HIT family hydrolase
MPISLRTKQTEQKYQDYLKTEEAQGCCFCRELKKFDADQESAVILRWQYWAVMRNNFPYDGVYETHDLLFPVRHVDFGDLTVKEVTEYNQIINSLRKTYHQSLENFGERQSQKGHYHIHFCKFNN